MLMQVVDPKAAGLYDKSHCHLNLLTANTGRDLRIRDKIDQSEYMEAESVKPSSTGTEIENR